MHYQSIHNALSKQRGPKTVSPGNYLIGQL